MEARRPRPCWFLKMERKYDNRRTLHTTNQTNKLLHYLSTAQRWILPEPARDVVLKVASMEREKFSSRTVVMPDHVHIVLDPVG